MTKQFVIPLALTGLLFCAAACDGDGKTDKNAAKGSSSTPSASTPAPGAVAPTTPASATPTATTPAIPSAAPSEPKLKNSKLIVMIDPDGKRYSYRTMAQLAAGMRVTMGKHAPSGFCAESYRKGVSGGGKFPAGRAAFISACEEGWKLGAHPPR